MNTVSRQRVKRLLDILLCVVTLPLTLPLMALIGVAVKVSSPGPVLYRALRVGRGLEPFHALKFRTMTPNSAGPSVTRSGDPRITPVGRWLRSSKLDELPQIINVIVGDMSLVGPRPEDPGYVDSYSPAQQRVLSIRPGIVSLAFLRFGHEQDFIERFGAHDTDRFYRTQVLPEKLNIELYYVGSWTLLGDLRILAYALIRLLAGRR